MSQCFTCSSVYKMCCQNILCSGMMHLCCRFFPCRWSALYAGFDLLLINSLMVGVVLMLCYFIVRKHYCVTDMWKYMYVRKDQYRPIIFCPVPSVWPISDLRLTPKCLLYTLVRLEYKLDLELRNSARSWLRFLCYLERAMMYELYNTAV